MAPRLDEQLARARAAQAIAIVVDVSGVSLTDSTGLSVLIKHTCSHDQIGGRLGRAYGERPLLGGPAG